MCGLKLGAKLAGGKVVKKEPDTLDSG